MRRSIGILALLACGSAAAAPPQGEVRVEVEHSRGPQQVVVLTREFPVGGSSGWHRHPGVEIGQVLSGVTEMRTAEGVMLYAAGDTFVVPRGVAHNGVNVGEEPARIAITYLVDKDAPLRADAIDPNAGH
jgi:quercetin dioxygenase-like cupin family protein